MSYANWKFEAETSYTLNDGKNKIECRITKRTEKTVWFKVHGEAERSRRIKLDTEGNEYFLPDGDRSQAATVRAYKPWPQKEEVVLEVQDFGKEVGFTVKSMGEELTLPKLHIDENETIEFPVLKEGVEEALTIIKDNATQMLEGDMVGISAMELCFFLRSLQYYTDQIAQGHGYVSAHDCIQKNIPELNAATHMDDIAEIVLSNRSTPTLTESTVLLPTSPDELAFPEIEDMTDIVPFLAWALKRYPDLDLDKTFQAVEGNKKLADDLDFELAEVWEWATMSLLNDEAQVADWKEKAIQMIEAEKKEEEIRDRVHRELPDVNAVKKFFRKLTVEMHQVIQFNTSFDVYMSLNDETGDFERTYSDDEVLYYDYCLAYAEATCMNEGVDHEKLADSFNDLCWTDSGQRIKHMTMTASELKNEGLTYYFDNRSWNLDRNSDHVDYMKIFYLNAYNMDRYCLELNGKMIKSSGNFRSVFNRAKGLINKYHMDERPNEME